MTLRFGLVGAGNIAQAYLQIFEDLIRRLPHELQNRRFHGPAFPAVLGRAFLGYAHAELAAVRAATHLPLVASGGAGAPEHFADVFERDDADAALAASVFHSGAIRIGALKAFLAARGIRVRQ